MIDKILDRSINKDSKGYSKKRKRLRNVNFNDYFVLILSILYNNQAEEHHKDKIWNIVYHIEEKNSQTGLDYNRYQKRKKLRSKEYLFEAITIFKKLNIVEVQKEGLKDVVTLTDAGIIIAKFFNDINNYQKYYHELNRSIEKLYSKINTQNNRLRGTIIKQEREEVTINTIYYSNALDLKNFFDKNFFELVKIRYWDIFERPSDIDSFFILYGKHIQVIQKILKEIIVDKVISKTLSDLGDLKNHQIETGGIYMQNYQNPISRIPDYEFKFFIGQDRKWNSFSELHNFFNTRVISKDIANETKNMVLAFLELLEYPNVYDQEIEEFLMNKDDLLRQHIESITEQEISEAGRYDYKKLIRLRFDTFELFAKCLKEYRNNVLLGN